jgi:hypothetical protein
MTLNGHLQNARFCEDRKSIMITFDFLQIVHKATATDICLVTNVSLQVQPTVTL